MTFADFALAHGVLVRDLYPSGRIVRCGTVDHPRSRNGSYLWDGRRGWVMAWDRDGETHWYDDPHAKPWTDEEKRQWVQQQQAKRRQLAQSHHRAAQRAAEMLKTAQAKPHDYLARKGFPEALGLCLPDGALFVPMRNVRTNELQGAQLIRWLMDERKWDKRMIPGMKASGAVFRLGPRNAPETILCEGYATGLSIERAIKQMRLRMAVLVCFSAANIVTVAGLTTGRRFVFADNDASGTGEDAARRSGLPYSMAPVVGWDANDWISSDGLLPACGAIASMRESAPEGQNGPTSEDRGAA